MEFRGRCWRRRIYRGQNLLECSVKDKEYSFRGRNLGDAAGDSLSASGQSPLGMCVSNGGLTWKYQQNTRFSVSPRKQWHEARGTTVSLSSPLREEDHMEEILLLSASPFLPHYHLLLGSVWLKSQIERSRFIPDSRNWAALLCVW
jgi:hypothetical protein